MFFARKSLNAFWKDFAVEVMQRENIGDVKLNPEKIPVASLKDEEICKSTVNQLKFWLKYRHTNQGGKKKALYER